MHAPPQFGGDLFEFGLQALPYGLTQHREFALSGFPADMGKAQEVERLRLSLSSPLAVFCRKPAKLNQPGLIRVQFQPKAGHPFSQIGSKAFRFMAVLKPQHKIIGKSHHDDFALRLGGSPPLHPQVEGRFRDGALGTYIIL